MTHIELIEALSQAGFETGWVVRGESIVVWENAEAVPDELAEYVELEEVTK